MSAKSLVPLSCHGCIYEKCQLNTQYGQIIMGLYFVADQDLLCFYADFFNIKLLGAEVWGIYVSPTIPHKS